MSEKETNFIKSIISENTEFADNVITSLTKQELTEFCFELSNSYGLLLITYLSDYFIRTKNIIVLEIIISLLVTELSHWEGKDFLELSLLKKASIFFPESIFILEALLSFSLPPYIKGSFDSFIEFNTISIRLQRISSENEVLKMYLSQ